MNPGTRPFTRLAVVNRGEPAMRLINAVREWNAEGRTPLTTIAVHTAVDARAMFVRESDESVLIGPDDPDHMGPSPYLDHAELERALRACGADAVWPGWGFVSEKSDFVAMCERLGITFVGPASEVMHRLGDKIESKLLAAQVGVPMAAWSGGPVADVAEARRHAETIGFPLMVKATAGGGGRGIRYVPSADELDEAFTRASSEASRTAGDATVFLERAIRGGRHVEVQVVADATGDVWTLGVRDCSVQRRNQKVIEESASTALDAEQEALLRSSAAELVRAAGYVNAGTVEFLYEPKERLLSFLEVNTRLQVEHCVTEATTGVDIVKLQLHVAAGGTLAEIAPEAPAPRGHAIEARLTAEDPDRGFAPAPGRIEHLALPSGPGVRVDTGVATGDVIPSQFDSMIAKVIAWGRDRGEARARLSRALRQTAAVIDGGTTNKAFLLDLLDRPEVASGELDTTWLDTMMADGYTPPRRLDVALLATAVEAHDAHVARQQQRLFLSAERGRPEVGHETWYQVDVRAGGEAYRLRVARSRPRRYRVELDLPAAPGMTNRQSVDVDVERSGRFERRLTVAGRTYSVLSVAQGPDYLVEVDGAVHRISGGEAGMVRAPAPAMVVAIPVAQGDVVAEGDVLAVVESMKLETALRAPVSGTVAEILVAANTQVEGGTKLIRLEPDESGEGGGEAGDRVDFSAFGDPTATADATTRSSDALAALRALVLGFDVDESEARPLLARLAAAREELPDDDPRTLAAEIGVLQIFADLSALSRNKRVPDGQAPDGSTVDAEAARNPQEFLYAYLRSRDADAEGLPESFRVRLRRALAHYGVTDLEPSADLGPALYRIFLAHRRASAQASVLSELLRWRLQHATLPHSTLPDDARDAYRQMLDNLVTATQLRFPLIGDVARQVRHRLFDAPRITATRHEVQAEVARRLGALPADGPERAPRIDSIVAAGEPILEVFTEDQHAAMLEVMTRRYYRIRQTGPVQIVDHGGRPVLTATYTADGHDYLILATVASGRASTDDPGADAPAAVSTDLNRMVATLPPGRTALIDLYVTSDDSAGVDPDARARRIADKVGTIPASVGRVAVAVRRADGDGNGTTMWFTFRAGPDGAPVEDRTLRGLHPMVAERLGLWRLSGFELTRLPSAVDVHLFRAQGRTMPEDQRLIALADVRALTLVRDDAGRITGLPELERTLDACLDSMRAARSSDPRAAKLDWNRLLLYVWPPVDVPFEDLDAVVRTLAPRTDGLGLEQVLVQFRTSLPDGGTRELMLRMSRPPGAGLTLRVTEPPTLPLRELDAYTQKVIRARRRGAVYPYELVPLVTRNPDAAGTPGRFVEYDLDDTGTAVPVDRAPGGNTANLVLGVVTTATGRYPEGMTRVVLIGDPTKALGALAEPECARVVAAIELARRLDAPVEWFAVSAGAKIAMDSGVENMDWISRALRSIVEFTQDGGEINVVVTGINVGAQPYWNAEATMLMHTKGILVMTPDSAMVLTGKQSLDYSGGVSAEDNFGIGGYDRIMGPNGQAQYWAPDLSGAVDVLLAHYAHTYTAPGERFPRPAPSTDPVERDISDSPHTGAGCDFTTLGEVFAPGTNKERKKPFDIRSLLRGVADSDHPTLERWADMHDAESVVTLDAHLGGQPVALLGVESRPLARRGLSPVDGPSQWTAGTLFPRSSKKMARAINAASGNRPVVILANLSGFDGSPESLRGLQLEYGAEIGRAVVNFDGPIVFCVVSRYHGGAFVVFSKTLNDNMEVAAIEGSYASVLGGAPAAAVVFSGEVNRRTAADPEVAALEAKLADAVESGVQTEVARLRSELAQLRAQVRSVKLGQVAEEFDATHSIERAQQVGSVDRIVPPTQLRPYLADAVQRGMAKALRT
ncbi:MAG: biotin/lipoyl-binding protein [Pseudonocardia sp.]|uniref:ATP-binding protein n=1 Tax=unclassified Pseudonocardia TaxID=2619320 RepID=UPI00086C9E29|nr:MULTISPECIES: carboxyl transferase domain-containing protein [unclassified Pseudonocardia]MBN9109181.1 biotin/lipoyl-binding protein [Pseudonocardia sp.]ODU25314.1 MAG: fused acetyl/propionyl-CoA carboxylase subuit alpha/methylmalonyl-CoA decarboxylase subunit alpha [Pseudonocardia sp. SCN 72-51]ODV01533.1 MAG: fused acetyl/propionyl-CoA carboxylase subuit alpha/methylmalonyl-CoA decarboxylase subunit alpha [Pseudonocardia sp. SCN 73-27]